MKKRFSEENIIGFLQGRCRDTGEGAVSQAWLFRSLLLPVAQQVRRNEVPEAKRLKELESENARLKKLLAESLLEAEVVKEVLRKNVWSAPVLQAK